MGQCEKGRGRALASKDFLYAHALVHWGHANDPLSHSARGVQTVGARACSSRRRRELRQLRCPTHRLVQIHGFRVQGPGSRVQGTPTHSLFPPRQHACRRRCHYRHRPAPTEQHAGHQSHQVAHAQQVCPPSPPPLSLTAGASKGMSASAGAPACTAVAGARAASASAASASSRFLLAAAAAHICAICDPVLPQAGGAGGCHSLPCGDPPTPLPWPPVSPGISDSDGGRFIPTIGAASAPPGALPAPSGAGSSAGKGECCTAGAVYSGGAPGARWLGNGSAKSGSSSSSSTPGGLSTFGVDATAPTLAGHAL